MVTEEQPKMRLSDREVVNFPVSIPRNLKIAFYELVPRGKHSKVIARLVQAYVNKELKKKNAAGTLEEKAV